MAFDSLDIEIGASTAGAKAAIGSVTSSLTGFKNNADDAADAVESLGDDTSSTAGKLTGLAAATQTAGGGLTDLKGDGKGAAMAVESVGDKATTTAVSLGTMSGAATTSSASLTGLSSAGAGAATSITGVTASAGALTTAIVGLSAALAPLAATFGTVASAAGGLATAFGSILGSGLIAFGQKRAEQNRKENKQIKEKIDKLEQQKKTEEGLTNTEAKRLNNLNDLIEEQSKTITVTGALKEVFGNLKDEIKPLIVEFGTRFIPLIKDTLNAIPTLIQNILNAIGPLDAFKRALRDAGSAAMGVIPTILSELVGLGRQALPILRDLITTAGSAVPAAFDAMIRVTKQVGDDLLALGGALVGLLPELTELGVVIIEGTTPILITLIETLGDVLSFVTDIRSSISNDLVPAVTQLGQSILTAAIPPLLTFANNAISTAAVAIDGLFSGLMKAVDAIKDVGSSINTDMIPLLAAAGVALTTLATGPVGVTGAAVAGLATAIASNFEQMKTVIKGVISGDITTAFAALRDAATNTLTDIRIALVGESGNGGILNNAIREAGSFLRNNGVSILKNAIRTVVDVGVSTFNNLKIALIGQSGQGGLLNTIITEYVAYLKNTAPQLVKTGYSAIGQAIGVVARDIYNAITGDGDSVLRSIIKDFVAYLKNDAVDDLMAGLEILKEIMIQGAAGLARGFANGFGNISFQPLIESFNSVANTINGFIEGINSQFGMIDIGARVPTASGDILEGGVSIGGGSGGSDGSSGIDFNFGGSDGSDGSGDSGSDDGFDFDFDFGSDDGSGTDGDEETGDDVEEDRGISGPNGLIPKKSPGEIGGREIDPQKLLDEGKEHSPRLRFELGQPHSYTPRVVTQASRFVDRKGRVARDDYLTDVARYLIDTIPSVSVSDITSAQTDGPATDLPSAQTGGLVESSGILNVHAGERVVPEAQVSDRGAAPVEVNMDSDAIVSELRQLRQSVESGDTRVSDRDLVRGLERLFDRHGGTV